MWRTLNWKGIYNERRNKTNTYVNIIGHWLVFHYIYLFYHCTVCTLLYVYRAVSAWKSYNKRCCTIWEKKTSHCYIIWFLPWWKVYFGQVYNQHVFDVYVRQWFLCRTYLIPMAFVSKNIPSFLSFLIEVLDILQKYPTVTFSPRIHTPVVVKKRLKLIWRPNHLFNSSQS